jgi:hypothetical protein
MPFTISPTPLQQILPSKPAARFEGLAYSADGSVLAAATADTNAALLFRRGAQGTFAEQPFGILEGLAYPHDVAFADGALGPAIAVAQRHGGLALFEGAADGTYSSRPVSEVSGAASQLEWSDGVAFMPGAEYLAACNLSTNAVTFYPLRSRAPLAYSSEPELVLTHPAMRNPDGLAFSGDGRWLATANHGGGTLTLFRRRSGARLAFSRPATFAHPDFRYPHSVAFTDGGHIAMTNAGANYLNVFRFSGGLLGRRPSLTPVAKFAVNDERAFHEINAHNKMEGGPKGLAIHGREIAVCSPEIGIKIFRFSES